MTKSLNKLQIRAELLNAVKMLESGQKHTQTFLEEVLSPLLEIEDKKTILDILIKEIISSNNNERFFILSFLIENIIPKELLENELWKLLELPHINDAAKANIINILKDLGNQINYEKYTEYFENPDSIIDADTEKMLKSAIYNPEALIDFLDFIEALPETDKSMLIDSLCQDYNGDELANLFIPVIYANPNSNLCLYAIQRLGDSKSTLAIRPLNFILEHSHNDEILTAAKKSLSALKLAGARIDNTEEFYEKIYADSKIDDILISMPDGHGNVGILVSRKRNNKDSLQMFAVVFNDTFGIIDCFGFNDITTIEFNRIVNRFYSNQEKIGLCASVAKLLLDNAEKLALKKTGKVSYEYVCWKNILNGTPKTNQSIEEVLSAKLEKIELTQDDLRKLYSTSIFDKWFLYNSNNQAFDEMITEMVQNFQPTDSSPSLSLINNLIEQNFNKIWDDETINHIEFRLLLSAYLLNLNGLKSYANILFSIIYDKPIKNLLLLNMLRQSIYEFLLREKYKYQNTTISTNIFSKRNKANKALISKQTLDFLIKELEQNWSI